ncbi:MAG TPA: hypothetical protein VGO58_10725 [Chitinophagaceae bacterium]|jgi:hypothetical protein|nr:hypothetical protein [Chitinophagaceae bacterium]
MKKVLLILLSAPLFIACGKSKTATQIAEEICDCSKKANAMDASDPKRSPAQADCLAKQGKAWLDVKDDMKKADEFNAVLSKCASEQIKKSFGQ